MRNSLLSEKSNGSQMALARGRKPQQCLRRVAYKVSIVEPHLPDHLRDRIQAVTLL